MMHDYLYMCNSRQMHLPIKINELCTGRIEPNAHHGEREMENAKASMALKEIIVLFI